MPALFFIALAAAALIGITKLGDPTNKAVNYGSRDSQLKRVADATRQALLEEGYDVLDVSSVWINSATKAKIAALSGVAVNELFDFHLLPASPVSGGSQCSVGSIVVTRRLTTASPQPVVTPGSIADAYTITGDAQHRVVSLRDRRISLCASYEQMVRGVARAFENRAKAKSLANPSGEATRVNYLDNFVEGSIVLPSLLSTAQGGVIQIAPTTSDGTDIASLVGLRTSDLSHTTRGVGVTVFAVPEALSTTDAYRLGFYLNPPWLVANGTPARTLHPRSIRVTALQTIQ
jgi:hypothetical protein